MGSIVMLAVPGMSKNGAGAYKFLSCVASAEAQDIFTATVGGLGTKMTERWTKGIASLP